MARRYVRLLLALALVLTGCTTSQRGIPALNATAGPENAVARITYRDGTTEYISRATLEQFQQLFGGPEQPAPAEPVLNELISRQLLLRQARNADVTPAAQEVEQFVANVRSNPQACGSRVQAPPPGPGEDTRAYFDECARGFGFADGTGFRNFLAEQLTINAISSREAEKDQIRSAHILWRSEEGNPQKSQEDYAKALEAYRQLCGSEIDVNAQPNCRAEIDFQGLARQLSEEPGAEQSGGELPPFNRQGLTEDGSPFDTTFVSQTWALEQAFEERGVGISLPFETQFGWHIVKVLDLVASADSGQRYRDDVLQRARDASLADLQQPDQGPVPLLGVAEVLVELPQPPAVPTIELPVPEETATPEATSAVPAEGTATPDAEETTTPDTETTPTP